MIEWGEIKVYCSFFITAILTLADVHIIVLIISGLFTAGYALVKTIDSLDSIKERRRKRKQDGKN